MRSAHWPEEQNSIAINADPVPVDFTSETQANSDCGDGLILDDLENDKPHDNIEVYVERNNLRHDDVPHDNL